MGSPLAIGVDVGPLLGSGQFAGALNALGARMVRARLALDGRAEPDQSFLDAAAAEIAALRSAGLEIVVSVGSDITLAPGGLGAFEDPPPPGGLHEAWEAEWRTNLARVAAHLHGDVAAWELLPYHGGDLFIAPRRWLVLLVAGAEAIRSEHPRAVILPGAVVADDAGEPERTLNAALGTEGAELWHEAGLAGLVLDLRLPGSASEPEAAVIAGVRRAVEGATALAAERLLEPVAAPLVMVSWSASRTSDDVQARNLWSAFNTLTTLPSVGSVIWRSLTDDADLDSGLFRGPTTEPGDRRPAWAAFNDFTVYAAQIAPRASPALDELVSEPPAGELIKFTLPTVGEILRAQGLHGRRLDAAVATATRELGEAPPPGTYEIRLPPGLEAGPEYTNQDLISAFYRAGHGSWDLLERSGLALRDLATDRNGPYTGPAVEMLVALDEAERVAVADELQRAAGTSEPGP